MLQAWSWTDAGMLECAAGSGPPDAGGVRQWHWLMLRWCTQFEKLILSCNLCGCLVGVWCGGARCC